MRERLLKKTLLAIEKAAVLAILLCPAIGLAQAARLREEQRMIAELREYAHPSPFYIERHGRSSGADRDRAENAPRAV